MPQDKVVTDILTKWFKDPIDKPCPYCEATKEILVLIEQAKAKVAEDIGGLICCLAGNLMLEDRKAGDLLASQLQPLVDTIKLRYLPHLPRKKPVPD